MNLGDIQLTKFDKIWLETVYDMVRRNERPSYRKIRIKLNNVLPREYHPSQIDERLVRWKGTELTLLGVNLIDPSSEIMKKADLVLKAIRERVMNEPELRRIDTKSIANVIDLPESEVGFILTLIPLYGNLYNGSSYSNEYFGYSGINLDDSNDKTFEEYLYYEDINKLIERYFANEGVNVGINKVKHGSIEHHKAEQATEKGYLAVKPIFRSRAQKNPSICFVIMPFKQDWSSGVFNNVKSLVESLGYQCLRADNQTGRIIMEDIWIGIIQSAFIVADVTDTNPNVMYELGIADTVGTPVILLTQGVEKIPFDLKHYRHIVYKNTIDGWKSAQDQITNTIKAFKDPIS